MADLVEVKFLPADKRVWVQPGTTVLDAGEAAGLEIVVGCTSGMCGTDPIRITAGLSGLEPPGEDERGTLERMGLDADYRLACSARLTAGPITVELGTF